MGGLKPTLRSGYAVSKFDVRHILRNSVSAYVSIVDLG